MKSITKYTIFSLLALLTVSCVTPKVADLKQAKPLPEINLGTKENKAEFQKLQLRTYFTDPHLLALFDQAVVANPDYLIAQQRIEMANSILKRTKRNRLPSLELGAIASGTRYGDFTMEGVGNYDTNLSANITEEQKINRSFTPNYWVGARSSWEADVWGRLKNQSLAAQKRFLASQEGLKLLKMELFTNIALLYYELVKLDNNLIIYQENYRLQLRAYEIIAAQRVVGKATELAVQQLKAQNKNIEAEVEHLKVDIIEVEKALRTLIGSYEGEIIRGKELLNSNFDILNANIPAAEIINSRPDVMAYYYELEASRADAKAAKAAFYPRLQIEGFMGYNAFSSETLFKPGSLASQLLGGLMIPVFNKGQLKQEFAIANGEQEIAFLNYQKTITTAFNEIQAVLKEIEIYERVMKLKLEEVNHLNKAVEVSNDLYATGYANYLELINARKNKIQADLDFLRFKEENTRNNIMLFKALGGNIE
ncbi:TolC family protein [Flavobacterium sp. HXWNR69]|uniref:TolC family protein n=1 Tax=Flavobacterium fragile TaxID=2949085 RepID=A0ABT0THC2_9FLAO|nr:TolC family protein [Flavobacterium sp. HXWNR69]MCL9770379.1 TolC family protein [Flavobacterium sp. HXWNR69]